jgi:hypothetical protein
MLNIKLYKYLKFFFILLLILAISSVAVDYYQNSNIQVYPDWPPKNVKYEQERVYSDLVADSVEIDWNRLNATLENMDDFRMVAIIRILYEFENQIPDTVKRKIEKSLTEFRYWWDEPGGNSMCYWSENHQILYASEEFLAGQFYPDKIFSNTGLTGKQHQEKGRKRILSWLEMRWKYGFTEFNSNVYYKEDIAPLINLIDYANDDEIVRKSEIIMDLLFYDVAVQSVKNTFSSASGRAYENNRKGGLHNNLNGATNYYWGDGGEIKPGMTFGLMTTRKYKLPAVLSEIAHDTGNVVIRQANGLDLPELKTEGFSGTGDESMMMQLGMEAFTNPEVVHNTLNWARENRMFTNYTLAGLKTLNFTIFRILHLEPLIVRMINPPSNGVAIQKGNVYTYKTKDYSLYAAQNHHPGTYGDQQHVAGMNIGNSFSIFHTHPALSEGKKQQSPNYWVGYGRLPHVAQDSSVNLAIYDIPQKKSIMEKELLHFTHAWFPKEQFDSVYLVNNYAFGKKGDTYCAFIAKNPLNYKTGSTSDIIQEGRQTFWITEAGSRAEDGSFDQFYKRILNNKVIFHEKNLTLTYESKGKVYQLKYNSGFWVDDKKVNTNYNRYDSPYIQAIKGASEFRFACNGKFLNLDFENGSRSFN